MDQKNQYILYTDKPLLGGLLNLTTKQHIDSENKKEEARFDEQGCQIIKSPYDNFEGKILKWPFHFFWTQLRLSWEMLIKSPDVLFIPAHTLPFIHPKKSLITIHDIAFERERWMYSHEKLGPESNSWHKILNLLVKFFTFGKYGANILDYHSWSARFALLNARKVITVSHFSKKDIINQFKINPSKIKVIYNGYNRGIYKPIEDNKKVAETLESYGIAPPYLLYIGRLEKKKNTPALVEAYAVMKEENKHIKHKLVLVGDASHGYDEVKYVIREYNLDDDVIITGWVPELDMPYLYSAAAAFIFPSLYEGFGIPLLQAMACGIPVAASQTTSIPEIAGGAAVYFNPKSVKSIADAMAKIINQAGLREYLIKKGLVRAANFSWEKCANETLEEIYNL